MRDLMWYTEWIMDSSTVIDTCGHYFKELIGPQLLMTKEVSRARQEFYDVVGCIVHDIHSHELDADFTKDEVDKVLRHLPSGKSPGWDDFTNEVFKRYSNILKGPLTLMFQLIGILVVCLKLGRLVSLNYF